MTLFSKGGSLLRNTTRRIQVDRELTEEVGTYVELLTEKKMNEGMNEKEARRAAMVEVGGVEQVKENVREGRMGFAMETFVQDIRYGLRSLLKKPGFTLTAVIALALGIGANTAIFSVINGVLLRSLAYGNPERIVMLWEKSLTGGNQQNVISPGNFLDWEKQSGSFEHMAAVWDLRANLTGGSGEPEEIKAQFVSAGFFSTLGVQPVMGRAFLPQEDKTGNELVIILSHEVWQTRFGSDPQIVGKQATVNGRQRTIVGVMPPGFHFLDNQVKAWAPLALDPAVNYRETTGRFLRAVARLKPGVSVQQAQGELAGIAKQLEQAYPTKNINWGINVVPMHEQIVGEIRPILIVLLAAVAFVLLIACANVANLLLSRAAARQKELALRAALGAGRARLLRQMMTESVLLALMGGALGVLLAVWGIRLLIAFGPDNIPRLNEISVDLGVLAFTFAVSLITGLLFGLVPALQASRPDLNDALKEGGRGSTSGRTGTLRNAFVVAEVSLALVLLIGAGLMIRSFARLQSVNTGFQAENVLTMRAQLPGKKYPEPHQIVDFFKHAQERIATIPGVQAVGAISYLPLTGLTSRDSFKIPGQPSLAAGQEPGVEVRVVTPAYFQAMGIPLLKGRLLDERDVKETRVLLINETLAKRYFPNTDPLGKQLEVMWDGSGPDEIVGVVGDIREGALTKEPEPAIYWSHPREPYSGMALVIRATGNASRLTTAVQKEIRGLDPEQPISEVRTMEQVIAKSIARPRFNTLLLSIFAGVALVLASVGLYGVMNYSATQRTHEVGIRMALGATRSDIMKLVVGNGMMLTVLGIGIGIAASLILTRVMASLLFGVTATDLPTFAGVSAVLAGVALIANYIPARRATRVNPVIALRYE
ncbi:MAG TPA: ABC transporter permease [Chthoniobacterales bacterium]|nr:ABC transporter permease [Chthoniobacterales bacterium]